MPEPTLPYLDEVALLTAPDRRECDLPASLEESPGGPNWPVRVRDLSLSGMGLVGDRPLDQGQQLVVGVRGEDGTVKATVAVEVVYRIADEGGQWRLGCLFSSPLTSNELRRLCD